MSDDLTEFYGAQLDEDERCAQAALPGPWMTGAGRAHLDDVIFGQSRDWPGHIVQVCNLDYGHNREADAEHIVLHDPARVLRDVAAGRKLLRLHAEIAEAGDEAAARLVRGIIADRAASWSDHPGYRLAWAIDPGLPSSEA